MGELTRDQRDTLAHFTEAPDVAEALDEVAT